MKYLALISAAFLFSCSDPGNSLVKENEALKKENDSLKNAVTVTDSGTKPLPDTVPRVVTTDREGVHPISLQWISWEKKGEVLVSPSRDGWYTIKGSQSNETGDRLVIDGKIKRTSAKELEFEGTIETKVSHNNGGEACIKTGKQIFAAKGNRTYFRLQNMTNCEGGNLVDYVDIYPGTSSL